jgi:hypothetical protein
METGNEGGGGGGAQSREGMEGRKWCVQQNLSTLQGVCSWM